MIKQSGNGLRKTPAETGPSQDRCGDTQSAEPPEKSSGKCSGRPKTGNAANPPGFAERVKIGIDIRGGDS